MLLFGEADRTQILAKDSTAPLFMNSLYLKNVSKVWTQDKEKRKFLKKNLSVYDLCVGVNALHALVGKVFI